jgi:hypothetical protein
MSSIKDKDKLLNDLEKALQDPILRGTVGLGIYARELCSSMGVAHTILLLTEQAKRLIDGVIEDPEDRAALKMAIIEDFADKVIHMEADPTLEQFLDEAEEKGLTKKKEDLN